MSRVYFHAEDDEAELRGSERAYCDVVVRDMAFSRISGSYRSRERYERLIPADSYMRGTPFKDDDAWMHSFKIWWNSGFESGGLAIPETDLSPWIVSLNTALVMGNDPLILMARIHATCEIHGFVEGKDRAWLADIMDQGRASGLYRKDAGWEDVAALLRKSDEGTVVMSYSVCDGFPNSYIADWEPPSYEDDEDGFNEDEAYEHWYELSNEEQWALAMKGLREFDEAPRGGIVLNPETFRTRGWGNPQWSIFDIENWLNEYGAP